MYQQGLQGAELRTLGPVATGGGKQPTFCTVRAQRMVRPMILHLYGSPPCGKGQDMWLQTAFHPKAIQGLYLPYPKLKTQLPPYRTAGGI